MSIIKKSTLTFLKKLAQNNNRDWFQENKKLYEAARENTAEFADALLEKLRESDVLETMNGKKSLYRIYRDVRFSKNKMPYKTNFAGGFTRDGKLRRGGYYFHLTPDGTQSDFIGGSMVGGGFYGMETHDLKRIREELAVDAAPLREIMADKDFQRIFGDMRGEKLKTAPRGYDKNHPDIDLLNHKQFYAFRSFSDKEVTSAGFLDQAHEAMLALRPFFDYFSDVLTTDANGEVIV
ncbi:DUF2461 domain-containing protein [Neolewinella agarilytica]|uniref:TIGR02453 family protein n=1 Tax=Neolewinella agarilytica TaxID=478744 RepID=A0A1H9G6Z6_9BACT|nr:DUF2461 domain-containing protein [Neolewinella agarilytica]SEQ45849.1 TIGR02453 family protein [Neolewinella agarilytica]